MSGKHDPKIADEDDKVIDDDQTLQFKEKFQDTELKVEKALMTALNSHLKEEEHHSWRIKNRVESGRRLKEKVGTASVQILELVDAASEAQ